MNFIGNLDPMVLLERNVSDIKNPCAIISPHAGYIFSGDVASSVFNTIDQNKTYKNVFILSTSHTSHYKGASCLYDDIYTTPFGDMKINKNINMDLCNDSDDFIRPDINSFLNDHTIEVILPFVYYRVKYENIVPIMIGDTNPYVINKLSTYLKKYLIDDNLFIISSDFSHYPSYSDAIKIDNETKDMILKNNSTNFLKNINKDLGYDNLRTRMCGWSSYLTLLYMIENENIDIDIIKYKNSGDTIFSDKNSVVGYFGISFSKKK